MTEINNRIEEVAKKLYYIRTCGSKYPAGRDWDKCLHKELWLSNARQICQLFPQPLDDKELEKALLTDEDFIRLFTEEQKKQGVPDKYNFPEAIAGNVHYHRVLAKAQQDKDFALLQPKIEEAKRRIFRDLEEMNLLKGHHHIKGEGSIQLVGCARCTYNHYKEQALKESK